MNRCLMVVLAGWLLAIADTCAQGKIYSGAYFCDGERSQISVSVPEDDVEKKGTAKDRVEYFSGSDLVDHSPEDSGGNFERLGTRTVERTCGEFVVLFSGGWLNYNPNGRGGADEFLVVSVRSGSKIIVPETAIGSCNTLYDSESGSIGACPEAWATEIWVSGKSDVGTSASERHPFVSFTRTYTETRSPR